MGLNKTSAPAEVRLNDPDGKQKTIRELSGESGVVLGFLHGTYCPACLQVLNRANFHAQQLSERGVKLAWVLQDKPTSIGAYRLAAQPAPRYELLADNDPSAAESFSADPDQPKASKPRLVYVDGSQTVKFRDLAQDPHAPLPMEELLGAIDSTKRRKRRK